MRRKVSVLLAAISLAGSLILSGTITATSQASVASFSVSGTVARGQGPVHVALYLWPPQAVTAALKPGQKVPLRMLASQTTSSGSYALNVDPTTLGLTIGAIANLEVVASGNGGMGAYSFSRRLIAGPAGRPALAALFAKPEMAPQTANLHLARVKNKGCGTGHAFKLVFKKNLGEKHVIVGSLYSRVRDITAKFTYKNGQSSSLGVGMSVSSADAGFSASGTHSISSSATVIFPKFHGHTAHLYKTEFRYGRYRWRCSPEFGGNSYWGAWQVQANDFGGGASSPKLSKSPNATNCTRWEGGSTFHKDTSSAYEYTKGVSISGSIGINLSSHTGYDSNASLSYVVGKIGRDICGLKGPPAGNSPPPRLIVAGSP